MNVENHPILSAPVAEMYKFLETVDPQMALRWHPKDQRKIKRSIEIYLTSGRKPSEVYAEQLQSNPVSRYRTCVFWLYSEQNLLNKRLDNRVDEMVNSGLLQDIEQLRELENKMKEMGESIEYDKGIWQSIGYKEFQDYFKASEGKEKSDAFDVGLEKTKRATRKYAKGQIKWIKNTFLPLMRSNEGEPIYTFVLDATPNHDDDISGAGWNEHVRDKAIDILRKFESNEPLPDASSLNSVSAQLLSCDGKDFILSRCPEKWQRTKCDVCKRNGEPLEFITSDDWERHKKSRSHKNRVHGAKKHQENIAQMRQRNLPVLDY